MADRKKTPNIMAEMLTGTPIKPDVIGTPSTPGTPGTPEYIKKTFVVKSEHVEKIKALAFWERRDIKNIMAEALDLYLQGKDVKPIP